MDKPRAPKRVVTMAPLPPTPLQIPPRLLEGDPFIAPHRGKRIAQTKYLNRRVAGAKAGAGTTHTKLAAERELGGKWHKRKTIQARLGPRLYLARAADTPGREFARFDLQIDGVYRF